MEEQLSGREEPCYLQSKWTWLWATIGEMKSILPSLVLIVTALRPCSTFTTPTSQTERGSIFKFASYYNSRGDDYYDDEEYYPRRRGLNNYYDRQGTHHPHNSSSRDLPPDHGGVRHFSPPVHLTRTDTQGSSESFRRSSNGRYYNRDDRRSYDSSFGGSDLAFGGQRRYG